MSNSVLYAVNVYDQTTTATGTIVTFTDIVRRYGCNLGLSGGNVIIKGAGYYALDVNLSVTATAAGTITVNVYKDGTAIPGATAVVSTPAASSIVAVAIPAIIRNTCNCEETITVVVSGVATTVNNAAISVDKL